MRAAAANQPRLLLTAVVGAGCQSDPVVQCLSDFSLELVDDACTMKPNLGTQLAPATATACTTAAAGGERPEGPVRSEPAGWVNHHRARCMP